jgi:hypothetical protein
MATKRTTMYDAIVEKELPEGWWFQPKLNNNWDITRNRTKVGILYFTIVKHKSRMFAQVDKNYVEEIKQYIEYMAKKLRVDVTILEKEGD